MERAAIQIMMLTLTLTACVSDSGQTRETISIYEITRASRIFPKQMRFNERRDTLRTIYETGHWEEGNGLYDRVDRNLIFVPYIFLVFPETGLRRPADWEWRGVKCTAFFRAGDMHVSCPKGTSYVYRSGMGVVSFSYGKNRAEYVLVQGDGILREDPRRR